MIKTQGVATRSEPAQVQAKTKTISKNEYKAPVGKVHNVLKQATKADLQLVKSNWAELLATLSNQNLKSVAALLDGSEPVAASSVAFVVKFKYNIHCKKVMESASYLERISSILQQLIGKNLEFVGIPNEQWMPVREEFLSSQNIEEKEAEPKEEDPFVTEARNLVGDDLLEIKD